MGGRQTTAHRLEKKILSWDQTAAMLARLADPNRLVIETCVATSARISEVTGLMIKHFDPAARIVRIVLRNWRMDIDTPKTEGSKRGLALGDLCDRYLDWIAKLDRRGPNDWIFPQASDPAKPMWDSGIRKAVHDAAQDVGWAIFPASDRTPSVSAQLPKSHANGNQRTALATSASISPLRNRRVSKTMHESVPPNSCGQLTVAANC